MRGGNGNFPWNRIGGNIARNSRWIIILFILLTVILMVPAFTMSRDEMASSEPGGEVFELLDKVTDRLPEANLYTGFIVEARDGEILEREELLELYENEEKLRNSELGRTYLVDRYDWETESMMEGLYTMADAVQSVLNENFQTDLKNASDDQIKVAVHFVMESPGGDFFRNSLSEKAHWENGTVLGMNIKIWHSPALLINTFSNNRLVLDVYSQDLDRGLDDMVVKEHYNRELQEKLRGEQESYRLWGVAIDVTLESEDEGAMSFPLIFLAVILILVIVTVIFRSFKVLLLTVLGIVMIMAWMFGLSNLVGLKPSLTTQILVPVSILVLGVDYLIHSLHRYEEEKVKHSDPRRSFGFGIAGVGSALFIAMVTTVVAFGSNGISDIEEIVGFGVSASLAIVSAFLIMGFFVPAVKMELDNIFKAGRNKKKKEKGSKRLARVVTKVADKRKYVIPSVLVLSIISVYFASNLEARLDVKEFFDPDSDFVVSLDKLDEHVGSKGGEPIITYIEGDLSDPEALKTIRSYEESLQDNQYLARDPLTNRVMIYMDLFDILERIQSNHYAFNVIQASTEGDISDTDNDSIPEDPAGLRSLLDHIHEEGVPLNSTSDMFTRDQVGEVLWKDPDRSDNYATIVMAGIPGTRELSVIGKAEEEVNEDREVLNVESIDYHGVTGPGLSRDRTLNAITSSLNNSIVIAIILCFVVLVVLFRSFKYAFVTVIPELLVAAWLYGFMYLSGYHINSVTATIAAISIGVGIDYSVHMTARFLEEKKRESDRRTALGSASRHSGSALLGSAASTMFGFMIIGLAPMPMFSSFGILTALMIIMALTASLFVLPSLLMLVSGDPKK